MPDQVGGTPNPTFNPAQMPGSPGPNDAGGRIFHEALQRATTTNNIIEDSQLAGQTQTGQTQTSPNLASTGGQALMEAYQASTGQGLPTNEPQSSDAQRAAQGPQPSQTQSSPQPGGQPIFLLKADEQGGGQGQHNKRRGSQGDGKKASGVEGGDRSEKTAETATLEDTPAAAAVATPAGETSETTSTAAAEASFTPERLASMTEAEIKALTPQLLEAGIAAADVEAARLRAQARELRVAGFQILEKTAALNATALPLIEDLVEQGRSADARTAINDYLAQGEGNIREAHANNPEMGATVLAQANAIWQAQGLRTDSPEVVLPRLQAGAELVKQARLTLGQAPAPSIPPAQTASGASGVTSRQDPVQRTGSPSFGASRVQAAGSSSVAPAERLPGITPSWARPLGPQFWDTFESYIPENKQDPALFDKVRTLGSDDFLAALDNSDYASDYVRSGSGRQLSDLHGLPSFAEINPDGSVKAIYVRQNPGSSQTDLQAAAIHRAVLTYMHPTFKTTFTSDGGRAAVVAYTASQHPHPSTNASTWGPAQGPGIPMVAQSCANLGGPDKLYRAYFGGDQPALRAFLGYPE